MQNPYEHDDRDGVYQDEERDPGPAPACRNCGSHDGPFHYFGGWPWCSTTCYREIVALYMQQPHRTEEELRNERFNQVRR